MANKTTRKPKKQAPKRPAHRPPHDGVQAYQRRVALRMDDQLMDAISSRGANLSDGFRNLSKMALAILADGRQQVKYALRNDKTTLRKIVNAYRSDGPDAVMRYPGLFTLMQRYALLDAVERFCRSEEDLPIDNLLG